MFLTDTDVSGDRDLIKYENPGGEDMNMYAATVDKKRGNEFERKQEGVYEKVWRIENTGMIIIISKNKRKNVLKSSGVFKQGCILFPQKAWLPFSDSV